LKSLNALSDREVRCLLVGGAVQVDESGPAYKSDGPAGCDPTLCDSCERVVRGGAL